MTDIDLFFADNVEEVRDVQYVASKRFKDKNGKPLKWTLHPLTAEENAELKRKCNKRVQVPGHRGTYTQAFDQELYERLLVAKTVKFPPLDNADLQDSWAKKTGQSIKTPEDCLNAMLTSGEFDNLSIKCSEVAGYIDMDEATEEAKN